MKGEITLDYRPAYCYYTLKRVIVVKKIKDMSVTHEMSTLHHCCNRANLDPASHLFAEIPRLHVQFCVWAVLKSHLHQACLYRFF